MGISLIRLVGMPAETCRAITSMIFGGVFERLPNLKVSISQSPSIHLSTYPSSRSFILIYQPTTFGYSSTNNNNNNNNRFVSLMEEVLSPVL